MKNFTVSNASSKLPGWLHRLTAVWHWLIEPSPSVIGPERRLQARLLMAMLLTLIILGVPALAMSLFSVYTRPGDPTSVSYSYLGITLGCILLLVVEYALSRTRHFPLTALLAVGTVLVANFVTVTINPQDLRSSSFLILGGLIGSLFLSVRTTALVFFVTFMGLLLLPAFAAGFSLLNNLHTLFLILMVGVLVVMAAMLRQRYLAQIDLQTQQLIESEARLRELSIRDPLTGLLNRRRGWEVLADEIVRSDRYQRDLCVIMLDIDNFKTINDTQGHLAGDLVLTTVAKVAGETVRSIDQLFRWGGEEFLVVLPDTELEAALHVAERLREAIARIPIQVHSRELNVTASLGVTRKDENTSDLETLVARADQAMYVAKHLGRDRVARSK
jgi:diguanylate cyclase (GGDEF)-like protein